MKVRLKQGGIHSANRTLLSQFGGEKVSACIDADPHWAAQATNTAVWEMEVDERHSIEVTVFEGGTVTVTIIADFFVKGDMVIAHQGSKFTREQLQAVQRGEAHFVLPSHANFMRFAPVGLPMTRSQVEALPYLA